MAGEDRTKLDHLDVETFRIKGEDVISLENQADVVAPLTENGAAIGGVNNSDIPDLTASVGAVVVASVGADIAAFTDPPTAGQMATLRTFVNALKADQATIILRVNALISDVNTNRAGVREVASKANEILTEIKESELMASV